MSDHATREAADWLARRNGGLTPAQAAEFAAWRARDPRHAQALAALEETWAQLTAPRDAGAADAAWHRIDHLRRARAQHRRRAAVAALGAAACLALGAALWLRPPAAPPAALAGARPAIRTLDDGSKIALRPGAEIAVEFDAAARRVRLVRGEALFSVAKDAARPFVVRAGTAEVHAVGTEFSVAHGAEAVTVFVTEGRIAVTGVAAAAPPQLAHAGQRVTVPAAAPPAVATAAAGEIATALAWRGAHLDFFNTPLAEAVRLFNRAGGLRLELTEPALARRTITGVFWADDSEGLVRLLESGFDLVAEREGDTVRLRTRR